MNAKLSLVAAALLAAVYARAADERIEASQLPPPVQKTLEAARGQDPVKQIIRRTDTQGRVIYEVEIDRNNAPNPRLRIAEDGTTVRDVPLGATETWGMTSEYGDLSALYRSRLTLAELPPAAQESIRREAGGREIADIDEEKWNGRTVYEVEFRQQGRNPQIHVADDGTVLHDEPARRGLKSLFLGTQIKDTPEPVQATIRRVAGDREVSDIDIRGTVSQPVYRIVLKNGDRHEVLHIAKDGTLLQDNRRESPPSRGD